MTKTRRQPSICHCGEHCWVATTMGYVVFADADDLPILSLASWSISKKRRSDGSVYLYVTGSVGRTTKLLSRLLKGEPPNQIVDHVDGNTLNDRQANLRVCTSLQNTRNRHFVGSPTGFKGVQYGERRKSGAIAYRSVIWVNGRAIHLGIFDSDVEAAMAYDAAAIKYFMAFARTNFPAAALSDPSGE